MPYNVISLQPLLCLIRDEKNEIIHVLPEQGREQGSTPPRDGEEFLQDLTLIGGELTRDILNIISNWRGSGETCQVGSESIEHNTMKITQKRQVISFFSGKKPHISRAPRKEPQGSVRGGNRRLPLVPGSRQP